MGTRSPIQDPHSLQVWRNSICPPCISSHIVLAKKTPAGRDCSELMSKQIVGRMKAQWFGYSPLCVPPARDYPMSRQRITPFTRYHRYTPPPHTHPYYVLLLVVGFSAGVTYEPSYKQAHTEPRYPEQSSITHPTNPPFSPDTI